MKIWLELDVPDDFETSMDMQHTIEGEIMADRWSWHKTPPELTACRDALLKEGLRCTWIPTSVRLPDKNQNVAFVVDGCISQYEYMNGRILGGKYLGGHFGGFSVPGSEYGASYWLPLPTAPNAEVS